MAGGTIDYWCNAFSPDRRALWDAVIAAQGIPLKVRRDPDDSFCEAGVMVERMDALGIDALVLPVAEASPHAGATDYERFATQPGEFEKLVDAHPGRFLGLASIDPTRGQAGVRAAADALAKPGMVGLHNHTHSWDRAFDDRDYYPFYALAAQRDVAFVMQAGASGGRMPSECGRPIGVDRPALYFESARFVLSHTGWPWTTEAIAMAQKHPNVFLGTAGLPPHHWSDELVTFLSGVGRGKTLFGTTFPVVGHRHALDRLPERKLAPEVSAELLGGAARRVFPQIEAERGRA